MTNDKGILVSNIFYMLSYAYQALNQDTYRDIDAECFDNVLDLLAAILAKGITQQLKQGLSREYVENKDTLEILKGKICIKESMPYIMRDERRLTCCYDEYSANHQMNQILKTAAWFLICHGDVKPDNRDALKKAYMLFLSEIDVLQPSEINWRSLNYHRNNATYKMLMNICYFVIHDMLLTTRDGKHRLAKYFNDRQMSDLYERFILEYYKKHHPDYKPEAKQIRWDVEGDTVHLPKMLSDIVLTKDRGSRKLIIDAKYYRTIMQSQYETEKFRSGHLYQMFAYVKNEDKDQTGLVDGVLLYAKTEEEAPPAKDYVISGNRIGVRVLDLNKSFRRISEQLDRIAEEWAH